MGKKHKLHPMSQILIVFTVPMGFQKWLQKNQEKPTNLYENHVTETQVRATRIKCSVECGVESVECGV